MLTTLALFGTGVALLVVGPARLVSFLHKASFIAWFALMALHVLGHMLEVPSLAVPDWRARRPGGGAGRLGPRVLLLAASLAAGLALALATISFAGPWLSSSAADSVGDLLNQPERAEQLDLDLHTVSVSRIEHGKQNLTWLALSALVEVLEGGDNRPCTAGLRAVRVGARGLIADPESAVTALRRRYLARHSCPREKFPGRHRIDPRDTAPCPGQ